MRSAPSRAAVSRTCCNRLARPSRCSTLGSADFMRVPLPAAMITMSSAMRHPSSRLPCEAARLSRVLLRSRWRCWRAAARCGWATTRRRRWPTGGSTATPTSTTPRRRACASARRLVRLAPRTQLPDYAALLQRAQRRGAGRHHAGAGLRLVRASWRARIEPAFERAVPAAADLAADADAGADRAHRAPLREEQRGVPRRLPAARPGGAPQGVDQARGGARRDALRPARRRRSASIARGVAASPFDPSAGWPSASGASRTCCRRCAA